MATMNISKSIEIAKPIEEVFGLVNDFQNWTKWSPWYVLEPTVKQELSDNNKYYAWEGELSGSGNMRITNEVANKSVDIDLTFLKPWKSKAKVGFVFESTETGCRVTWNMESKLPFFLFFMKKMMSVFVGMDFDRGLLLLKETAELGKANCQLNVIGNTSLEGGTYIGIEAKIAADTMPSISERDFTRLMEYVRSKEGLMNGPAFTLYHDYNPVKNTAHFISGAFVTEVPGDLPTGVISGSIPTSNTYAIGLKGSYHHLGNPWSAIQMHMRAKKFKPKKGHKPLEIYRNTPNDTPTEELITEIHMVRQ